MRCGIIFIVCIVLASRSAECARILGLFPHIGKSHYIVFQSLLQALADRGHDVTTVSFFPIKNPPPNYKDVSLEGVADLGVEALDLSMFEFPSVLTKIPVLSLFLKAKVEINILGEIGLGVCEQLVRLPTLADAMKEEYDVILTENFVSDCMMGILHVYGNKAPVIGLSSSIFMAWVPDRYGLNDNPAYVPIITSPYSTRMNFLQRLGNFIVNVYSKYWFHEYLQKEERAIIEKHFNTKIPDLEEIARNQSVLMLVNSFPILNGAKPLVPSVIEVGGMHLNHTRKELPPYIEKFLNESEHGVILLSFGSLIKTSTIPKYKEDMIVNALAKLKQRVIWKFEGSGEEGTLTGNILRVKWLPQYELLQNKKVVAFIAHGGLLGMTEAISAGKPMVVVPFFGDQPANAAAAAAAGFATVVPYIELTEEKLTKALEFVLSAETRLNARRVSSIWRDRQADPLETAVYWTERVIRWGHHAQLHSPARDMPLYQIALLDVIATLVIAILIILAISWYILSKVFRLLFGRESKLKMH
ncbi:UDP-glycosyltransferase UGT5-like isoform X1 [Papilio machaon]|uniref:UDP-glycosyltransferase UGT5-like isoform X1 n=1 Tax=Papilio machaon TaxID=76193 RepID=UPI001E66537A|nr:UDP-glycosyltransferase UGT5-like isoform X1 [Papilio machaon]